MINESDPVAERRAGLRERLLDLAKRLGTARAINDYSTEMFTVWDVRDLREAAHALEASSEQEDQKTDGLPGTPGREESNA